MKRKLNDASAVKFVSHFFLIVFSLCCLIPFLIIVGSSFEAQGQIMKTGYTIIPKAFTLEAYKAVFANPSSIINAYKVTVIVSIAATVLGLLLESTYAYVLSRRDYPYRRILSFIAFFTMLFNGGLVPTYILITNWLKLKNTLWALILPGMAGAWHIMMLKTFFMSLPISLIESAKLDGAKEITIFFKMIIPLSKPALACIALFILFQFWNGWYSSLLYIDDENKVQLQYLLMAIMKNIEFLNSAEATQLGANTAAASTPTLNARMAMCVLAMGPIVLVFPFFQKYFVQGLTVGSVKG